MPVGRLLSGILLILNRKKFARGKVGFRDITVFSDKFPQRYP
jgi:hypothetical protein